MIPMKNKNTVAGLLIATLIISIMYMGNYYKDYNKVYAEWVENENGKSYKDDSGNLLTGLQKIEDKRYYFDEEGYLKTGKFYVQEEDSFYYADDKGVIQTGYIELENAFYLTDDSGKIKRGFVEYGGQLYFFNSNADVALGWFKIDDKWYYGGERGAIATGFINIDGLRYYLGKDGVRVSDTIMEIEGTTYIFKSDGSVDENATLLYPVYQYIDSIRTDNSTAAITINSRVQACAMIRATSLSEGYNNSDISEIETLLNNRAVKCDGGYEFSYGGLENYTIDMLINHMKLDGNLNKALKDKDIKYIGIGKNETEELSYFDIILVK